MSHKESLVILYQGKLSSLFTNKNYKCWLGEIKKEYKDFEIIKIEITSADKEIVNIDWGVGVPNLKIQIHLLIK